MVLALSSSLGMQAPFRGVGRNGLFLLASCSELAQTARRSWVVRRYRDIDEEHQAATLWSKNPTRCSVKYAASSPTPANRADPRDHCQLRPMKHRFGRGEIPR